MTPGREQLMRNEPLSSAKTASVSWWTCSQCGALIPLIEQSPPLRLIRPKCCGLSHCPSSGRVSPIQNWNTSPKALDDC